MTVQLTSPVLGKGVGEDYTGPLESWLLAEGYAEQAGYTGPGVSNTGSASADDTNDPRLAANREKPYFPSTEDRNTTIANDKENLTKASFKAPSFDFDAGASQATAEAPTVDSLEPDEGPTAGGTEVTAIGSNFTGVTGVTVGGVAATGVAVDDDYTLRFTTPAGTAGAKDVVVTDPTGTDTEVGGFTYA